MPETTEQLYFEGFFSSEFQDFPDYPLNDVDRAFWDAGAFYGTRFRMKPEEELQELIELESHGIPELNINSATRF